MNVELFRQQLVELAHQLGERGLAWGTAGNLSVRVDNHHFLISASGAWLGMLTPEQSAICSIHHEDFIGAKPSIETPMHRAIYRVRPEAQVVVHVSPLYATIVACSEIDVPTDLNIENMLYLGRIVRLPYIHPGTPELASAVFEAIQQHETLILSNHGVITFHSSIPDVLMRVESFEMTCRILVKARAAGIPLVHLPASTVEELRSGSVYRKR